MSRSLVLFLATQQFALVGVYLLYQFYNVLHFATGNFKAGPEQGTILKKLCPKEELCFQILMKDVLRPYVPEYKGHVTCEDGDCILDLKKQER
jgi:hypothetical protein